MLANIFDGIMNAISMGSLLANLMGVTLGILINCSWFPVCNGNFCALYPL